MPSSITILFQSVVVFGLLLSLASCTDYQLGFLLRSSDPPGFARNFTGEHATLPAELKQCEKLCATGMWAMYTKPNFGADKVDETLVYPIQANGINDCTAGSVNSILSQIESIKPLGGGKTDATNCSYYNGAYFLKTNLTTPDCNFYPPKLAEEMQIRSLAITIGKFMTPMTFTMCDAKKCYCHDQTLGLELMVPDVKKFPAEKPFEGLINCIVVAEGDAANDYRCVGGNDVRPTECM